MTEPRGPDVRDDLTNERASATLDGSTPLSRETLDGLAQLRLIRRLPLWFGVVGLLVGGGVAFTQHSAPRVLFSVLFPAAVLSLLSAWVSVFVATCPVCRRPFFAKLFVGTNIFRTTCVHCGLSLRATRTPVPGPK